MSRPLIMIAMLSACSSLFAQTTNQLAPGGPGKDAHWRRAAKNGFGTSTTLSSKVWFTLTNGVMSEVFYPTLDVPNVEMLQLVIVQGTEILTEADDTNHRLEVIDPSALVFRQVNTARNGSFVISKTYITDPRRSSVLINVSVQNGERKQCRCAIYLHYDPSLNNSGMHDSSWNDGNWMVASDGDKVSALTVVGAELIDRTNGFLGTTDGLTQLRTNQVNAYSRAENGNVVQTGRVNLPMRLLRAPQTFTVVLSFGRNASEAIGTGQASVREGFAVARQSYLRGWHEYVGGLKPGPPKYRAQLNMAAMVLKALEDKTYRGAMIASPSAPWGGGPNANEASVSGYHAVWSRDLYHVATAFQALGDTAAANRALSHLFEVQQKPDGSFPQNARVDGRTLGQGLQMDQVAFPIILAYQLRRTDASTWTKHIKPAADFMIQKGSATEQERWEEESGYSPSTIAAEIAGLICAAEIAKLNGSPRSAEAYLSKADEWAREVERWTATTNGPQSKGKYYLRISQGDPNKSLPLEINSGGGVYDQREIVDAGFLELVRLGIKPADDPVVVASLSIIDRLIRVETPNGVGWYRYNHDAYGERADGGDYDARTGKGRLWTFLTGERGEYEVSRRNVQAARQHLDAMAGFANDGLMIPEQVWDQRVSPRASLKFGEGTGSATPLAWSMAQFIRLATNIRAGRNLETPLPVRLRYSKWAQQ
ncbi:MAG: glycoside hydrolase family 15 protein [Acidobacteriota bacterium]|nr:glycoside hydrolase family 15 protein [Acidobacteriota bacterium]